MKIFAELPAWSWSLIIIAFFALIVVIVIVVKKFVKPLQINKPEIKEEDAIKEELDRILVPIEDESIQKQMDEATKEDGE